MIKNVTIYFWNESGALFAGVQEYRAHCIKASEEKNSYSWKVIWKSHSYNRHFL